MDIHVQEDELLPHTTHNSKDVSHNYERKYMEKILRYRKSTNQRNLIKFENLCFSQGTSTQREVKVFQKCLSHKAPIVRTKNSYHPTIF